MLQSWLLLAIYCIEAGVGSNRKITAHNAHYADSIDFVDLTRTNHLINVLMFYTIQAGALIMYANSTIYSTSEHSLTDTVCRVVDIAVIILVSLNSGLLLDIAYPMI